jgi:hypothetical protein
MNTSQRAHFILLNCQYSSMCLWSDRHVMSACYHVQNTESNVSDHLTTLSKMEPNRRSRNEEVPLPLMRPFKFVSENKTYIMSGRKKLKHL